MILPVLLAALLFQFLLRWLKKGGYVFGAAEWRFVTATMIVSTVVCISLLSVGHSFWVSFAADGGDILIFMLVLAAINLLCLVMVGSISKANRIRTENILLKIQNEYRENYAENTQKQYEESQRLRHDMKQSVNALAALCGQGKYDKLAEYLAEMSQHIDIAEATVNTGNEIVNAILNTKLSYAKSKGIKTLCSTVNDFGGIEDIDLCNLLGNMLDNAVEACLACPAGEDRYIEVSVIADKENLTVITKNSFNREVVKKNPQLQTTKSDEAEPHGFGVRTIKSIAERYQGKAEFYEEKDLFYVCVSLCR
jgi:sensor histidine kinase regulating citrate/malate metabolism